MHNKADIFLFSSIKWIRLLPTDLLISLAWHDGSDGLTVSESDLKWCYEACNISEQLWYPNILKSMARLGTEPTNGIQC